LDSTEREKTLSVSSRKKDTHVGDSDFPKRSRLLSAKDYSLVFDKPDLKVSNRFLLVLAKYSDLPNSRLGLVVAKKNIATAVQRNRVKRILRESFRVRCRDFDTIDIVVLVRRGLDQLENQEIHQNINSLLNKIADKP